MITLRNGAFKLAVLAHTRIISAPRPSIVKMRLRYQEDESAWHMQCAARKKVAILAEETAGIASLL